MSIDPEQLKKQLRQNIKIYQPLFDAQLKNNVDWRKAALRRIDRLIALDAKKLWTSGIKIKKL